MTEFSITIDPRFKYQAAVFVVKDDKEFAKFLTQYFPDIEQEDNGVALYLPNEEYKRNKYIGALFFVREYLNIGTINHEVLHLVLDFLNYKKKNNIFNNEAHEEYAAYLQESLTIKLCRKLKITKLCNISEKILNKDFKIFAKKIGF